MKTKIWDELPLDFINEDLKEMIKEGIVIQSFSFCTVYSNSKYTRYSAILIYEIKSPRVYLGPG